jgi:hypothetical protein
MIKTLFDFFDIAVENSLVVALKEILCKTI